MSFSDLEKTEEGKGLETVGIESSFCDMLALSCLLHTQVEVLN